MEMVLAVLVGGFLALAGVLAGRCTAVRPEGKRREKAPEAAKEAVTEDRHQSLREDRLSREMEEGFENLMRYSVNGKDGFGP